MALAIPIISSFDDTGIKKAVKEFQQLETTSEKAQFAIKKAAVPAAAALTGLAAAAGVAVKAASDMAEAQSKVNVIFGDSAKDISAFAKTASDKIGQSKESVLNAAGTFGTFGKAAGLSGDKLSKFATGFTGLASDLASFNNSSPEEAIAAIGSGLRGEAEPLRRFGILLNDATLKAEAMNLGIYDGVGALNDQQKILAAQSAIFKQSADAQGDFTRTSDGLANSQRILKAKFDDTKAAIGVGLLPVVEAVLPFLKTFADWAADNPDTFKIIGVAIGGIAVAIVAINTAMALNPFTAIVAGIGILIAGLAIAYTKFEGFRSLVRNVVNGLSDYFEFMANSWIKATNVLITAMNLISPFKDIPKIGAVSFGKIGAEPTGGGFTSTAQAEAAMFGGKGGSGGGSGGGTTVIPTPIPTAGGSSKLPNGTFIATRDYYVDAPIIDNIDGNAGGFANAGIGGIGPFANLTINVDGGDPNAVVQALQDYVRANGPVPVNTRAM